jgi:hypothetical protein
MSYTQNSLQRLESLENGFQLYGINIEIPQAQPGQFLQVGNIKIPVFNHQNNQLQFIADQNFDEQLFEQYQVKILGKGISNQDILSLSETGEVITITAKNDYIASAFFLVNRIRQLLGEGKTFGFIDLILLQADKALPFKPVPSMIIIPDMPEAVIATAPLFEDLSLSCRIACEAGSPGCFEGTLKELMAQLELIEPIFHFE